MSARISQFRAYHKRFDLSRDPTFIARVLARWDLGQDTAKIAYELMTAESFVANALAIGRDERVANDAP